MLAVEEILGLNRRDLTRLLADGHPIDPHALDDTEYQGVSLGLPGVIDKLAWKTFQKTFHRDPATGRLRGWNVRLRQTGVDGPIEPVLKRGEPLTWGYYEVVANSGRPAPKLCDQGLLIDYGLGGNSSFGLLPRLRDPLVALQVGSVDVLLGWSYLQLGRVQVSTPSFFLLRRPRALTHVASPGSSKR